MCQQFAMSDSCNGEAGTSTAGQNPLSIQAKLAREVLRKLRLAIELEQKEDRDIVCAEVFNDITGLLDRDAQVDLGVDQQCRFYEILAPYFNKRWDDAEALLYVCRRLWGQQYVAPLYCMLLHRWLLLNKEAGTLQQRQKHINVLTEGARQLFWGDVEAGTYHVRPIYTFMAQEVVFSADRRRLDSLPLQARSDLLSVVAAYLPYYTADPQALSEALGGFPAAEHTLEEGGHIEGEGADFAINVVIDTLRRLTGERGLLKYLSAILGLRASPCLLTIRSFTLLRLQAELYNLTATGGPRYIPRSVNHAAFQALDALFPNGQYARRLVSWVFKVFHPTEWPWAAADAVRTTFNSWLASCQFALDATIAWFQFVYRACAAFFERLWPVPAARAHQQ